MKISIKILINQKKGTTLKILKILKISHFEAGGFPAKFGVNIKGHIKSKRLEKSWFLQNFDFFGKFQILPFIWWGSKSSMLVLYTP